MTNPYPLPYVEFTTKIFGEPVIVRIHDAASTGGPIPGIGRGDDRTRSLVRSGLPEMVHRLTTFHIAENPNPTKTLIRDRDHQRNLRIDTQPATDVYRNIHLQHQNLSWAVCIIERGGEICLAANYGHIILKYLKKGLLKSFDTSEIWIIRIDVRKKKGPREAPQPITVDILKGMISAASQIITNMTKKHVKFGDLSLKSVKNANRIRRGTDMILHIEAAIERHVAKLAEEEGAHILAKKIPIVSTFMGIAFGAMRLSQGDVAGAFAELASGILADLPGAGTAASLGIDAVLLGRDIANVISEERNHRKLVAAEKSQLEEENKNIRRELAAILPESALFGTGNEKYFDESHLSGVDDIVKIHVRCGMLIDSIQVEYRHGGCGDHHGGHGGDVQTLHLQNGERIIAVHVSIFRSEPVSWSLVSSLTFITDRGREVTYGTQQQKTFKYEMVDGAYLAAIKGYDSFPGGMKNVKGWAQHIEVLPAIGFIAKY